MAKNTLLTITTCNSIEYTKKLVECLPDIDNSIDILFVDDNSDDGTQDFIKEKGYEIIEKDESKGLTNSWNIGYQYFVDNGYDFLVLSNNDVLIPPTAVSNLTSVIRHKKRIVGPLTNPSGVPYNRIQSIQNVLDDVGDEPEKYKEIQRRLNERVRDENTGFDGEVSITGKVSNDNINGFFFGVNREIIDYEYDDGQLFNPKNINIGNEVELWKRVIGYGFNSVVATKSFVYHYKLKSSHNPSLVGKSYD